MKCLNLGCGTRFHPDWVNLDSIAHSPDIIKHNLQKGIPFDDASFDVVYHSHVLEHFSQAAGQQFIHECYRVLRPQGILRVVVPDLEQIARTYLLALEKSLTGDPTWQANYDWILLELFDQVSRDQTGGEMAHYLGQASPDRLAFITKRIGTEAQHIAAMVKATAALAPKARSIRQRLGQVRELLYRLMLRGDYAALQIGRLRQSGEIHYQMYDRFSLQRLLTTTGFTNIECCEAAQSQIADWANLHLDTEPNGSVYKPDSLFMEAQKP
ncbi:MAG TPA: methyltransferase domain-containing protein [Nodosilinea sp.]|nr:methyltransferase domain-containing protein [Nodosilinea sp.]